MYFQKSPSPRVLYAVFILLCLGSTPKAVADSPSIRASIGSSIVFMEIGDPMFDLSGRLELEASRLTSQKPSRTVWIFEVIGMQVPYPAMRRYAIEPAFDTTTALFPRGSDFLWGFGTGVRLHLADISGTTILMRLTAGLCQTRDGMEFGGDHRMPRNPLYLYPALVLNLHRNLFLTFGTFITELREPQATIIPVEIGLKLL